MLASILEVVHKQAERDPEESEEFLELLVNPFFKCQGFLGPTDPEAAQQLRTGLPESESVDS